MHTRSWTPHLCELELAGLRERLEQRGVAHEKREQAAREPLAQQRGQARHGRRRLRHEVREEICTEPAAHVREPAHVRARLRDSAGLHRRPVELMHAEQDRLGLGGDGAEQRQHGLEGVALDVLEGIAQHLHTQHAV